MPVRTTIVALVLSLLASPLTGAFAQPAADNSATVAKYEFLDGSKWYVPTQTLPAVGMATASGAVVPLIDQTLWDITGYRKGYFWGRSVALFINPATGKPTGNATCSRMLGSVTPGGRVHIAFIPESDAGASTVIGLGTLSKEASHGFVFEMQMATGDATVVAHWSYMYQCEKGQACRAKLPGTNLSLAAFLAQCP